MDKLFDLKIDLKIRLFYVLAWTACIANTLGYLTNALLYGFTAATLFPFCCALVIYAASAYGLITKRTKVPVILILLICNLLEFPVLYCLYGAYRLSYMILGIVTTALFLDSIRGVVTTGLLILFDCSLVFWKLRTPAFFSAFASEDTPVSVIVTFLIACVSIAVMLNILLRQHKEQQQRMTDMTQELQLMANLDPLTQLYNRRYLTQYLEKKITSGESAFAVVLLDIDDFKKINDTYGHLFGDEVLQTFSKILLRHIRGHGIATRFGGEEFMLVFHSTDQNEMQHVLDHCAYDFKQYGMSTKQLPMTFSGGSSVFHNEDMLIKLFNAADERLYQAKNTGKKHVVYCDEA